MPQTNAPINGTMKNALPEMKTFDDFVKWCATPKGEPQIDIAWYSKRIAEFTD
jgi:hypothetical protein